MADTHKSTSQYVGSALAGANVGQLNYDWAFDVQLYYFPSPVSSWTTWSVGYQDATDFNYYTMNGAWGQWADGKTPTMTNIYSNALAAKSYAATGVLWNTIDDTLEMGSQSMAGNTYDERIENWNYFVDKVQEQTSWIWGDARGGGCGFLKYDNNSVFVISTYGTYIKEINGQTEYKIAATSGIPYSLETFRDDGAFVVYCRNRTSFDGSIDWCTKNPESASIYAATDPENNVIVPNDIIWSGHNTTLDLTFNDETVRFDSLGNTQFAPATLISMPTLTSPYTNEIELYYPEHTIDDASWICDEYDDGIQESPSLGGDDTDTDGDGSYDNSSDAVPSTSLDRFTVDAQDCGFVTVYKVPKDTLTDFGKWLFSDHPDTFWDWIDEIKKMWDNPMDCIMSLNLCAYDANTGGERDISFFGQASGYKAPIVDGLTQIFECGYLKTVDGSGRLREYSGNFLDYSSNCKISIFLPYCGQHTLQVSEVMGAKLHLQYVIDLLTGACIAELRVIRDRGYVDEDPNLDAVIYRFPGNIFQQIPIGASNYSSVLNGQLGLAASVASIATGNVAGGVTGAVNSIMSMSPHVERTGSAGSSYGYMSTQKPFIIQEYPWYNWNDKYDEYYGRPAYNYKKLGEASGYTEIDVNTLWTNKFPGITKEEEDLLKQELNSGGIYIDHDPAYYDYDPAA